MEFFERNPNKPWDWWVVSWNPNLTTEFIESHPDKPWDWKSISHNPNLTMEFIKKYPDKPWDWGWMSEDTFNWKKRQIEDKAGYCTAFSYAE